MGGWMKSKDNIGNGEEKFGTEFDTHLSIEECRFDPCKERLRDLFDQVLVDFLEEKSVDKCIRPIPAFSGDEKPVDLFKLFWVVRKVGGYDAVSRNNMWCFVSKECGLDVRVIPSIKLIYVKYLKDLDQWLWHGCSDRTSEDRHGEVVQKLDILSQELEARFRVVLDQREGKQKDNKSVECVKDVTNIKLNTKEDMFLYSPVQGINGQINDRNCFFDDNVEKSCINYDTEFVVLAESICSKSTQEICGDEDESVKDDGFSVSAKMVFEEVVDEVKGFSEGCGKSCCKDRDGIMETMEKDIENVSAERFVEKVVSEAHHLRENTVDDEKRFEAQKSIIGNARDSLKRKRLHQSLSEMLSWLKNIAKKADDPAIGLIPECSRWKDHGNEELWVQVLLVRNTLMIKRPCADACEHLKDKHKKPRMHPSIYEDNDPIHRPAENIRCSERVTSLAKPYLCPCCNIEAAPQGRIISNYKAKMSSSSKAPGKPAATKVKEPATNLNEDSSDMRADQKQVSVGSRFQAEVPEWTGQHVESDLKWLGTRMWPLENAKIESEGNFDPIGKGRHQSCSCLFPNSVECIRFHIAEKRFKLRREIGFLFHRWQFHCMGEEVSLSWTREEENIFRDMMRSYSAYPNKFWKYFQQFLPSKSRGKMVSYYFNVFLIRRRSYQNRVTPEEVDSDDDEKECGLVGDSFGYIALNIPDSRFVCCSHNMESTELP